MILPEPYVHFMCSWAGPAPPLRPNFGRQNRHRLLSTASRCNLGSVFAERRRTPRQPVNRPIILKVEIAARETHHDAQIIDLSPSGVKIRVHVHLEPGDAVEYCALDDPEHPVPCIVKWTGARGSDLEGQVGLQYVNPPQTK